MGDLEPIARTYPAGVTCWVEVATPDVDAATAFYGGVFGWAFEDVLPPGAPSRYVVATLDGLDVASVSGPANGGPADDPGDWATYVAVDDADATAAAMVLLGAELVSAPEDAGPGGRSAVLRDPQWAPLRLWQARRRLGAQLTNAPGGVELQRPAHVRPGGGRVLLLGRLRVAGRGPGLGDLDPGPGVRRPPGGHHRPGHPHPASVGARGLRRRHRGHGGRRGGRAAALARDVHRCGP
jgi:predicted enzyme related to lactoylglutathione lyase